MRFNVDNFVFDSIPSSRLFYYSRASPLFLQVQPDMEELTENAEEPDEGESKQSEQKLGKLKYKVNATNQIFYQSHLRQSVDQRRNFL